MATIETKTTEVRCDRCDKRIVKQRPWVMLQAHGVDTIGDMADLPHEKNPHCALDLCKPCEDSLRKWWARPKGDE